MKKLPISKKVLDLVLVSISALKSLGWVVVVVGLFDLTPNPNLFWMFNSDVEFDNKIETKCKELKLFKLLTLSIRQLLQLNHL